MQTRKTPCTLQRDRASRKADAEIIAEFERSSKWAAAAMVALFAFIFICEVWPW